jgi:poly-gamma-glutamate synthesis protein (capsule biosynthesis protein)
MAKQMFPGEGMNSKYTRQRNQVILLVATALVLLLPATVRAEITINAVGDIMLAGRLAPVVAAKGAAFPFRMLTPLLKQGDLAMGNLEAPLSRRGREYTDKRFRFRASPEAAVALKDAGFSLLTLANNHTMDYGATALQDTVQALDRCGIKSAGAGPNLAAARSPAVFTIKGQRLAFLAYSLTQPLEFFAARNRAGTAPAYPASFTADIRAARAMADHVIVSFHWGIEGSTWPTPIQQEYARKAIDAGAEVVIGHHPHVLQGMEYYKRGVILYSLGNCVFGSRSRTAGLGAIARITLGKDLPTVELIPLNLRYTEVRFQPRTFSTGDRAPALARIARLVALAGGKTATTEAGIRLLRPAEGRSLARYP